VQQVGEAFACDQAAALALALQQRVGRHLRSAQASTVALSILHGSPAEAFMPQPLRVAATCEPKR
jgi:hypothetical protein